MAGNVFLRIIPRQVKMVEAASRGEAVNQEWAKNAKSRSTHNTYFTLPVIFLMLSNHFSSTYGNQHSFLILLLICAAGAAIREYFIVRLKNPKRAIKFAAIGVALILAVIFSTRENIGSSATTTTETPAAASAEPVTPPVVLVKNASGNFNLKGVIKFEGVVPQGEVLNLPFGCAKQHKGEPRSDEVIVNNGRLKNALIRIIKGHESLKVPPPPKEPVVIDQIGCLYSPRVVGARVGQKVNFLNSDELFHNVRTVTHHNENFNESMPNKNDKFTKVFTKPEIFLQTKCSVHPWMNAYIAVVEHPYFSVSSESGEYTIDDLPTGTYTLEVWHEVFGTQTRELTVSDSASLDLSFTFKK